MKELQNRVIAYLNGKGFKIGAIKEGETLELTEDHHSAMIADAERAAELETELATANTRITDLEGSEELSTAQASLATAEASVTAAEESVATAMVILGLKPAEGASLTDNITAIAAKWDRAPGGGISSSIAKSDDDLGEEGTRVETSYDVKAKAAYDLSVARAKMFPKKKK